MSMTSGIRSVRRIDAVDLDGRLAAVLLGYSSGGRVAVGVAVGGADGEFALLSHDVHGSLIQHARAAVIEAAGGELG